MTFLDAVVIVQMLTMCVLAVGFLKAGVPSLALAQFCYVVATAALFFGQG